jgi:hypothetical protein
MADIYNPPPVGVHNFDGEVSDQDDEDKEPEMEGIQVTDIDTSGYYVASRRTINDDPFMVLKPAQQYPSRAANTSASTKTSKKYQPYQVALRFRPSRLATKISDAPVNEVSQMMTHSRELTLIKAVITSARRARASQVR